MDPVVAAAVVTAIGAVIVAIIQTWRVSRQFKENGGSTIKDQLNRIESMVLAHHREIGEVRTYVGMSK